jgi:hypothetical protein
MTTRFLGRTARLSALALPTIAWLAASAPAFAQQQKPDPATTDLQALRREMDAMRRRYDDQVKALRRDYETRLSDLERRLDAAEKTPPARAPARSIRRSA